jgi:hypothetical protein
LRGEFAKAGTKTHDADPFVLPDNWISSEILVFRVWVKSRFASRKLCCEMATPHSIWTAETLLTKSPEAVAIKRKSMDSANSTTNLEGYLLSGNRCHDFSLRIGRQYGQERMGIKFARPGKSEGALWGMNAHFFESNTIENVRVLTNAKPKRGVLGTWDLDLGQCSRILRSRKNWRLDDETNEPVVYFRKLGKEKFEVEARENLGEMVLFALCVATLIHHKRG